MRGMARQRSQGKIAHASKPTEVGALASVREALHELQSATREVLDAIPGLPGTRPVDLTAGLSIDLKLAWKIARIAQSSDPFECVRHLPGSEGWSIWLDAAARAGAARSSVDGAAAAFERALRSGLAWAGSRQALTDLAAGLAQGGDTRLAIEQRRQLFQAAGHVWGMRAGLAFRIDVAAPSKDGAMIDCATARGFVDLERLRAGAGWRLESPMVIDDSGSKRAISAPERLDSSDRARLPPFLLRDFCSSPLPGLAGVELHDGRRALVLGDGAVGPESRTTIVQGALIRSLQPMRVSPTDHGLFQAFRLRTVAEEQVFDFLIHRDLLAHGAEPEPILYSDLWRNPERRDGHETRDRLPYAVRMEELPQPTAKGFGGRTRIRRWPAHAALLEHVMARTGWSPAEFRHVRATVEYPPVPSTLIFELELARADG
jgi:hypothetical protein